jgi:RNA polymerase-binding transcription factor DksA
MTLDKKTLNELKSALLGEKEELEKSLGKIGRPVDAQEGDYETSFDDVGTDKEDNATEVEMYTEKLSVETTLEKKLQDILGALERIENGTYGKCENCDKDIPLDRLRANPSARTCMNC